MLMPPQELTPQCLHLRCAILLLQVDSEVQVLGGTYTHYVWLLLTLWLVQALFVKILCMDVNMP